MPLITSSVIDFANGLHRVFVKVRKDGVVELWTNKTPSDRVFILHPGTDTHIDYRALGNAQCPVQEELVISVLPSVSERV